MGLQQFIEILRARYKSVFAVIFGTITIALLVSFLYPKQYVASTDVLVDVKSPDPIAGVVLAGLEAPSYMATQVDIISSDHVAQRVVSMMALDKNAQAIKEWQDATGGRGRIDTWLATLLQRKLSVKPSHESNLITIYFRADDPSFAAAVANAFAQSYVDTTIDLKVEPARQYARWFQDQAKVFRENLEAAQLRLTEYQSKKGIVVTDDHLDNETAKLNDLSAQLSIAQGQTAESQSKQQSGIASDTFQEVMQNPLIQNLKADVARAEAKQKELGANLGVNHPQFKQGEAELSSLRERLATEIRQVSSSMNTTSRVSRGKEAELRAAVEAQKKKILDFHEQRDELGVLQREVETAQKAYDAISQRFVETSLQSKVNQTNVAILAPAFVPTEASFPKLPLNIIIAIILGVLLGIVIALAREFTDRRIRSSFELSQILGTPVLAELTTKRALRLAFPARSTD